MRKRVYILTRKYVIQQQLYHFMRRKAYKPVLPCAIFEAFSVPFVRAGRGKIFIMHIFFSLTDAKVFKHAVDDVFIHAFARDVAKRA